MSTPAYPAPGQLVRNKSTRAAGTIDWVSSVTGFMTVFFEPGELDPADEGCYLTQQDPERYELITPHNAMSGHNLVITPDNSPERFTEREAGLFRAGKCGWVTEYGTVRGVVHCGEPSEPGASMGHCAMHDAEMLVDYFPDGSSRYDANPHYDQMPDYEVRSARAQLEYLRGELRAERISYGELAELQGLTQFIEPGDTELLEAAGVACYVRAGEQDQETGQET